MYTEEIKYGTGVTLTDEEIKLRCLECAVRTGTTYPIRIAMEMYEWVKRKAKKDA